MAARWWWPRGGIRRARPARAAAGWTTTSPSPIGCFAAAPPEHPACAMVLDRDLNAALNVAKNLADLAGSSSESDNACGAASAGLSQTAPVALAVGKQQPDAFDTSVANGTFWRTANHCAPRDEATVARRSRRRSVGRGSSAIGPPNRSSSIWLRRVPPCRWPRSPSLGPRREEGRKKLRLV